MGAHTRRLDARTMLFTAIAMVAFAANSLLCRLALGRHLIDPAAFTATRMGSGALFLSAILLARGWTASKGGAGARPALMLFLYMAFFSFAYMSLSAGTGALILFGAVQMTMFAVALRKGEHFSLISWAALALAIAGLIYLVLPGVSAPDPLGAVFMALAGIAWGLYSLMGKTASDPLAATTKNFLYAVPLALILSLLNASALNFSATGLALAVISGAIASGCGYAIWYVALARLRTSQAAVVQLSVPVIAALGGVAMLGEPVTWRLTFACLATLGGVAIILAQRNTAAKAP